MCPIEQQLMVWKHILNTVFLSRQLPPDLRSLLKELQYRGGVLKLNRPRFRATELGSGFLESGLVITLIEMRFEIEEFIFDNSDNTFTYLMLKVQQPCNTTWRHWSAPLIRAAWQMKGSSCKQWANTMTACGTANLHTERWCNVQRLEWGLKRKKNLPRYMHAQSSRHMHCIRSVFITPPCGHSCDCTEEAAARPETLVVWPLSSLVTRSMWSFRGREWKCSKSKRRGHNRGIESRRRECAELNQWKKLWELWENNLLQATPSPRLNSLTSK